MSRKTTFATKKTWSSRKTLPTWKFAATSSGNLLLMRTNATRLSKENLKKALLVSGF